MFWCSRMGSKGMAMVFFGFFFVWVGTSAVMLPRYSWGSGGSGHWIGIFGILERGAI